MRKLDIFREKLVKLKTIRQEKLDFLISFQVRALLPVDRGHKGLTGYLADFICGACTGAFISTLFYPVNVTKTHMQLVVGGPYQKCWTVFQDLYRTRGLRGMFAGVHVNYTRSFISWGIINTMYEVIHGKLVKL